MASILFLYAFQIFIKYKTFHSAGPKFLRPGVSVVATTTIPGGLSNLLSLALNLTSGACLQATIRILGVYPAGVSGENLRLLPT